MADSSLFCAGAILRADGGADVELCLFSPDGSTLVSVDTDDVLRLWNVRSGTERCVLQRHHQYMETCAFSPDGTRLASCSGDCDVRIWNTTTGAMEAEIFGCSSPVCGCAFSPDGATLALAFEYGALEIRDVTKNLAFVRAFATEDVFPTSCAYSPDGCAIATTSYDRTVRLWNASDGTLRHLLRGHSECVVSCAFAPDGATLMSGSRDSTMCVWDVRSGALMWTVTPGHASPRYGCAYSPDGTLLISITDDGTIHLWRAATGASLGVLRGHTPEVLTCAFSPDGATLATGALDGTLRLWHMRPWHPATHKFFPPRLRASVVSVLALAHGHHDEEHAAWTPCYPGVALARLPHELVLMLCAIGAHMQRCTQ